MSTIGVDIGGTHLRAARVEADGTIGARARSSSSADPALVYDRIGALIAELDDESVAGIGIGVPGRVDFDARRVLSGGYVDLSGLPLAAGLEARFGRPVTLDNDCSMALVAESALGAAKGAKNVVMLTIGTGIGGAAMADGRILRARGTAGQFGHICVDPAGLRCVCGKAGCVETVSSGTALGRHIAVAGLPGGTTADELLRRRAAGDPLADGVLAAWAAPLRVAVDDLVAVLDPEIVLLGGGLGSAAFQALAGIGARKSWYESLLAPALLGDDAGVVGAALAARARTRPTKRLVLVNGVPASGKSGVAAALAKATGWPTIALDTIKNPFLDEIGGVDRPFNRVLGRASLRAMFAIAKEAPPGATLIMDAWFGFQPRDFVEGLLADCGIDGLAEVWCTAPPEVIGERYCARAASRPAGHPGAEYVPELVALAQRAAPLALSTVETVETTDPLDPVALRNRVEMSFAPSHRRGAA